MTWEALGELVWNDRLHIAALVKTNYLLVIAKWLDKLCVQNIDFSVLNCSLWFKRRPFKKHLPE